MESTATGSVNQGTLFSGLTSNLNIRGKLMFAFIIMIAITLVVSALTLISQTYAKRTIDDLVQVHGKIARLSLEADKSLKTMQVLEKSFLLKYQEIGIKEAREQYFTPFNIQGGNAYIRLSEIQQIATTQRDSDFAQSAIDSINEYLTSFTGTVNMLEIRVDEDFGELVKLEGSVNDLAQSIGAYSSETIINSFDLLTTALQEYLLHPNKANATNVYDARDNFTDMIAISTIPQDAQSNIFEKVEAFNKWFTEVTNTDEVIAARVDAYEAAANNAVPIITGFLENATQKEAAATLQMEETTKLIFWLILVVGISAILIGILIAVKLSRGLTEQVNHINDLLVDIGMGNYDARTEVVSNDELGAMASTLNAMLDNITTLIQSQAERDSIQDSIMKLLEEISALTEGDLTGRAEVTEDMTGAIADSFNEMTDQFSDIIQKVKQATASVDDTSEDVSKQTIILANKNIDQARKVENAIQSIDRMVDTIKNVSENALQSANVSVISRTNARDGAKAVQETNMAMTEIREQINETARSIKRLGESSMEIGNVIQIINDIADRTSILALNASIQAAMAGDAGHGFAVVADEVQRLAESSSNSTKQIESLVKNIQTEIKNVTTRMDESIGTVVQGTQLADGAHEKLQEIEKVSNELADLIDSIASAATEQAKVSEDISSTMQEIGEVSKESSRSSQETATSMDMLSRTARELRSSVEIFKVTDETQAA